MGERLGGKFSPPWARGWGGSFQNSPPTMGGKWAGGEVFHDWGGPPQAGNFAKLSHPNDDFPLENCISEGKISSKCQNFPPSNQMRYSCTSVFQEPGFCRISCTCIFSRFWVTKGSIILLGIARYQALKNIQITRI